MRRGLVLGAVGALAASAVTAAPVRVDYNGELVSGTMLFADTLPENHPYGWDYYAEGAGGGLGVNWTDSNNSALVWEDESAITGEPHPAYAIGHSVIFGGSGGAGRYGIKQTINSVAGKHYWMVGTSKGGNAGAYHQWGLSNGTSPAAGMETNGSVFGGGSGMGKQNYAHGMIATGNQITAMNGIRATATAGLNVFTDGIRVLQSDINVYSQLHNGGFDGARWNVTNWSGANPSNPTGVTDLYMFDGWLPLGGTAGQVQKIQAGLGESGWDDCLVLDTYKGGGRQYFFQRINDGLPAHEWNAEVRAKTVNYGNADNRIGIDPTGGLDPTSPNVIWSNTNTANNVWETLSVSAQGVGTNGITIFLASGWDFSRGNRIAGGTATGADQSSLSYFDSVTPEPASAFLLLVGGLVCLRRR